MADRYGIAPSRLDGREPAETTEFFYDDAGLMVRSVTTREPEWTEQDLAEVQALAMYRAGLCGCGCGFPEADTTSHYETGPEFLVTRTTCRARAAVLEAQRAAADGGTGDNAARLWRIQMRKG